LASIYEEKSTEQIAAQVGLSENATRQLIFRARAAFKKALLGDDVNTNGMSAAAILSVAARKAAMEAKKVGAQAMVFVLFMMLAIGAFVNFSGRGTQTQQLAESQAPTATEEPAAPAPSASASESAAASSEVVQIPAIPAPAPSSSAKPALPVSNVAASAPVASPTPFKQSDLSKVFDSSKSDVVFVRTSAVQVDLVTLPADYRVYASQGIFADFTFDYDAKEQFQNTLITVMLDGVPYFAYPTKVEIVTAIDKQGLEHVVYYASLKYLTDKSGRVYDQTDLGKSTVRLELVINKDRSGLEKTALDILKVEKK
jgi:RNA polymerase sigma-70 factor (ECF subfamily)